MRVYLTPPQPSRGLQRIADALVRYAPPDTEIVTDLHAADTVILYAIGRNDAMVEKAHSITMRGQRYAVIQVCLRSTMKPHTRHWRQLWHDAAVVWSYYDLNQAIADDNGACGLDNFYHAPLGADAEVFIADPAVKKLFTVATSGVSRLQESVRECVLAAKEVNGSVFHIGAQSSWEDIRVFSNGCTDNELAASYQQCEFVSGLRRTEGFELPAVEGLLCGARPILFRTPDYLRWYEPWGEFIEETDRQGVVDQLVELFKRGARPVTATERAEAVMRFNWETIIGGFYEYLK